MRHVLVRQGRPETGAEQIGDRRPPRKIWKLLDALARVVGFRRLAEGLIPIESADATRDIDYGVAAYRESRRTDSALIDPAGEHRISQHGIQNAAQISRARGPFSEATRR